MSKITGQNKAVTEWLQKIGIDTKLARRVIIDIPCNGPIEIYIESYGDSSIFEIEPPPELKTAIRVTAEEVKAVDQEWSEEEIEEVKRILDNAGISLIVLPVLKRKSSEGSPIDESTETAIQWINKWEGIEE